MRNHLSSYVDSAITILLLIVAGLTPVLFLNQTTEFFEMPKLVFIGAATLLTLGLWVFSWILKGKVVITRTPLDIPLVALMVVIIISAFFSSSQFISVFGNFPRVHGSAVSWVAYILLYFVTVSNLKSLAQIRTFLYVLFGSGVVVALVSILSFFGIFLPFDFARAVNFTPTGSSFSTIALMLLLLPIPMLSLLNPNKYLPMPAAMALSILFGVTVVLLGSIPAYVGMVIIFALCVFATKPAQVRKTLPMFLVPVIVSALLLALAYLPFSGNALQKMESNFPKEIQLPFATSWKVSASAFRDAPFIGTGPSTYVFNFTSYKPVEFNSLRFWNFSFDTAYNEFLQTLGTLGIFGLMALVLIVLVVGITSWRNISVHSSDSHEDGMNVILPALAISGIVSVVLLAVHAVTLVSAVTTLFIFATLMMSQKSIREKVMELSIGIKASTAGNKQFDLLPVVFFILFIIGAGYVIFRGYSVVAADYYHRMALAQANKSGTLTYQYLQKAESLNPQVDLYRVDMAQTNFALANALVAQKGPTEANPQGSLTDQDKQTIQTLLSQSINEGRASVALSPRSSRNWEVLASIYRNITGVAQNALAFSLDAYGRAIQRDPLNPILRVNVGGIYYAAKNYDLAIRFFSDAANLKPDYANAYYNLAIALRDKGDIANAALVAQQTVTLLEKDPKSIDYQVANNLLKELKIAAAKGAAAGEGQSATANQSNSALEQKIDNVNVSDLNNPPSEVATPSAVKNNPNARLPQATPTRAPILGQ